MFGTIRRHQKWLWGVISTLTIISFVYYFGPEAKMRRAAEQNFGVLYGRRIQPEEYSNARKDIILQFFLEHDLSWPELDRNSEQLDRGIKQHLFLLAKARENNVQVNDEAVAHAVKNFFNTPRANGFDSEIYNLVVKRMGEKSLSEDDLFRYFRTKVAIDQVTAMASLSGKLVPPRVAEVGYQRDNEQVSGSIVLLSYSNYLSKVVVENNALMQYYTNFLSKYRTPKKVRVSYVAFAATNYLSQADQMMAQETNLTATINQIYEKRSTNDFKGMSPEAARESIRMQMRHRAALGVVHSNSVQFANAVIEAFENNISPTNLTMVAGKKGYAVRTTEPFAKDDGPGGLPGRDGEMIAEAAFELSPEQPIGQPIRTTNATYLIVLNGAIPDAPPVSFESVSKRVTEDFRHSKAEELVAQDGTSLQKKISEGLAAGKTFKAICDEAKVKAIDLPFFSVSTRTNVAEVEEHVSVRQLLQLAGGVATGQVSRYVPLGERSGGIVFYVKERKPADPALVRIAIPTYTAQIREERQNAVFQEWFGREYPKAWPPAPQPVAATEPGQGDKKAK